MRRAAIALLMTVLWALWTSGSWAQAERGPDLVVQEIRISPIDPKPGDSVTVVVTVANVGNEDAGNFFVCVSISLMSDVVASELELPLNELVLARETVRRLDRNGRATVQITWTVVELPLIKFRASVDCLFNQVRETNEENNRFEQALLIDEQHINQWWLDQIEARKAHELSLGSPEIVVAVIDSGVDWQHPELADNIWTNPKEIPNNGRDDDNNGFVDDVRGWDFVDNDNDSMAGSAINFHGTAVAGIIANKADNIGLTGVAPRVKIMDVRAFDARGRATIDAIVKALDYAVRNGARIVNMSFGAVGCFEPPGGMRAAVQRAIAQGAILVAASGNFGEVVSNCVAYPAAYPGVISVGATGSDGSIVAYSQGGPTLTVVAPGGDISYEKFLELAAKIENFEQFLPLIKTSILAPYSYGGYGPFFGTSAAAPHVSGVIGLMLSVNSKLNRDQIIQIFRETSTDKGPRGRDNRYGFGIVNAAKAVARAKELGQ